MQNALGLLHTVTRSAKKYPFIVIPDDGSENNKNAAGCALPHLAFPGRLERLTYRLGGGCSIQLSYGNILSCETPRTSKNNYTT